MAVKVTDKIVQLPEQSGTLAAAETNTWILAAKATGFVAVDDAGVEQPVGGAAGVTSGVRAHTTTLDVIADSSDLLITFDAAVYDTDDYYSAGSPQQLAIPSNGLYLFQVDVVFYFDGTSIGSYAPVLVNAAHGSHVWGTNTYVIDDTETYSLSACYVANATASDLATVTVKNKTGGAITVYTAMTITRLGDALATPA
jgi:hypothetical protein